MARITGAKRRTPASAGAATGAAAAMVIAVGLCLVAFAWRLHGLARDPFWFDEIYSFEVVQQGLRGILANSSYDPHPPLYYLILWLSTGLGSLRGEWWWRISSLLFGSLTVPVVYAAGRRAAGTWAALCAGLWLVFAPTALYYSQETRWPAFAALLAAVSLWLLLRIQNRPADRRLWWAMAAVTELGVFSSYSYLMITVVQIPYVLWSLRRQRAGCILPVLMTGAVLAAGLLAKGTLPQIAAIHAADVSMTIDVPLIDLLVADPLHYGYFWASNWLTWTLVGLGLAGAGYMLRRGRALDQSYPIVQVVAPLAGYALFLVPILHIHIPAWEKRQFFVLLPAVCLLLAQGFALLRRVPPAWLGLPVTAGILCLALASDAISTQRYWDTTKTPAAQAIFYLQSQWRPADGLVTLQFSTDAAVAFFRPQGDSMAAVYAKPVHLSEGWMFSHEVAGLLGQPHVRDQPFSALRRYPRLWVLSEQATALEVAAAIRAGCRGDQVVRFQQYLVELLTDCGQSAR